MNVYVHKNATMKSYVDKSTEKMPWIEEEPLYKVDQYESSLTNK